MKKSLTPNKENQALNTNFDFNLSLAWQDIVDDPRKAWLVYCLAQGPEPCEGIDNIIAAPGGGPLVVRELRKHGLEIPLSIKCYVDKNGRVRERGYLSLSCRDLRMLLAGMLWWEVDQCI